MERVTRLETFARIGFLARGVVYILLGYLALTTSGREDTTTVLREIRDAPAGGLLLALVGIGLLAYGVFRLYSAALDLEGHGADAKGIATRIGQAASGVAHAILSYVAFRLALGGGGGGGGGQTEAAGAAMSFPGGEVLVALIGAGFVLAGVQQFVKAATGKFMRLLDPRAPAVTEYLGRAGYAARGLVFVIIGWQLLATVLGQGGQVGMGAALDSLRQTGWLYVAVALGLLLFGVFSLVLAYYRRIRDEDVIARLRAGAASAMR